MGTNIISKPYVYGYAAAADFEDRHRQTSAILPSRLSSSLLVSGCFFLWSRLDVIMLVHGQHAPSSSDASRISVANSSTFLPPPIQKYPPRRFLHTCTPASSSGENPYKHLVAAKHIGRAEREILTLLVYICYFKIPFV
jgi:hypothetical protein